MLEKDKIIKKKVLEEEKRDTLNKLLKRRATKSREIINEEDNKDGSDMGNNVLYKKDQCWNIQHS